MKRILMGVLLLGIFVGGIFWWQRGQEVQAPSAQEQTDRLQVAASFYPLAFFAEQVGGELVSVKSITPGGIEPHDYEPKPSDIVSVEQADVFLYNGAGLDPWAVRIGESLEQKGVTVLNMSEFVDGLLHIEEEEEHEEDVHGHEDEEEHEHGTVDPHFWLDPVLVQKEVDILAEAFSKRDKENKEVYEQNAIRVKKKLEALNESYVSGLSNCQYSEIIVSHDAFSYLGKRYTIDIHAINGISPEEEPSPRKIQQLSQLAREQGLNVIFFETLVSPKLAETVAREVGAQTLVLSPIEGLTHEEQESGKDYFILMQENLNNLRTAMVCQ